MIVTPKLSRSRTSKKTWRTRNCIAEDTSDLYLWSTIWSLLSWRWINHCFMLVITPPSKRGSLGSWPYNGYYFCKSRYPFLSWSTPWRISSEAPTSLAEYRWRTSFMDARRLPPVGWVKKIIRLILVFRRFRLLRSMGFIVASLGWSIGRKPSSSLVDFLVAIS